MKRQASALVATALLILLGRADSSAITGGSRTAPTTRRSWPFSSSARTDTTRAAAHCWITFDPEAAVDKETWLPIEGSGTWYLADGCAHTRTTMRQRGPYTADYTWCCWTNLSSASCPNAAGTLSRGHASGHHWTDERAVPRCGVRTGWCHRRRRTAHRQLRLRQEVLGAAIQPQQGRRRDAGSAVADPGNVPSPKHGSGCGGDSGSGIFLADSGSLGDTILAVDTSTATSQFPNTYDVGVIAGQPIVVSVRRVAHARSVRRVAHGEGPALGW